MAVESESFTELTDEFALVAETAADAGGERAPGAAVVTVPGAGTDSTARPAALAAALVRLIAQPPTAG